MKRWWQRRSLSFKLAAWYGTGGVALLVAFAAAIHFHVSDTIARPLDYQLRLDLDEILRRLVVDSDGRVEWDGQALPTAGTWNPDDPWFELWDEHQQLVRRCWPLNEVNFIQPMVAPIPGRDTISIFNISQNLGLRVLSVPYQISGRAQPWMIRVYMLHQPATDALGALRWIIFTASPVVIALLVISGYGMTRRWLSPLDRLVASAEQINAENLKQRLPVENAPDELGRMAIVFNHMLDRLESAFLALERFGADASHELRTPLTALRNVGEVGLRRGRTVEEYREIIGSMLEEAHRLELLVQRLLELARADAGSLVVRRHNVRIDHVVSACVGELRILAEDRGQTLVAEATECSVMTDPMIFRQALQNLIDNAIKYSPDGATVHVQVSDLGTRCEVSVTDQGSGISEEHRAYLAERFFRPDNARGRANRGFGLGLALTKAYMRSLGGSLDYAPAQPQGSIFRLTLAKQPTLGDGVAGRTERRSEQFQPS